MLDYINVSKSRKLFFVDMRHIVHVCCWFFIDRCIHGLCNVYNIRVVDLPFSRFGNSQHKLSSQRCCWNNSKVVWLSISWWWVSKMWGMFLNVFFHLHMFWIGHVNVQRCFHIIFQYNQSACSTIDWVLNSPSEMTECCLSIIGNFL